MYLSVGGGKTFLKGLPYEAFHLIEQPIEAICSPGPRPLAEICRMASKSSRRASGGAGLRPDASRRPRYCSSPLGVITKEVRGADRSVSLSNFLALINQVRKGKIERCRICCMLFGESSGLTVASLLMIATLPIPRVDDFAAVPYQVVDDGFDEGAVIADEHDQQSVRAAATGQRVALAVNAGKVEIDGGLAKITDWWVEGNHVFSLQKAIRR